jgi:RNA polymerase sigma factor (TIGR02999 family)
MAAESPDQTLQPTALVHEAYLRLVKPAEEARWENRGHFFAAAAEAMRRILVDAARRKRTEKHGGLRHRVDLPDVPANPEVADEQLLALDAALTELAAEDPVAARVVELRHFTGLSIEDAATALGLSRATAYRHWTYARAWLRDAISGAESD